MNENIIENVKIIKEENSATLTFDYVLKQIESVLYNIEHIHEALLNLGEMPNNGPDDFAGQAKVQAIADVVKCRETTNQKLLMLYEKMYDDLKPNSLKEKALDLLESTLNSTASPDEKAKILDSLDSIRHINN